MKQSRDDDETVPAPWWGRLLLVLAPFLIGLLGWLWMQ